ncbi:hypothetical protein V2J09_016017 [Rumex salicifolius]
MGMAASEQQFHILAVDDSFLDRKLIERLLRVSSYKVTTVDSGLKALDFLGFQEDEQQGKITNQPCDSTNTQISSVSTRNKDFEGVEVNLVITDYCMPEMTGYDLLKKMKESSSLRIRSIPVVILSSENVPSRITRCLEGGAEEFFIKPMRLSDVNKLRPLMVKPKFDAQEKTEQDGNNNDFPEADKQEEEEEILESERQNNSQDNNNRKLIEEEVSPDRTRQRYSGLSVV